jgi:hypothetical protein
MSAMREDDHKRESLGECAFWEMIREGLLLVVKAIERRHLPHLVRKR